MKTKSILTKRVLPVALSMLMVLGSGFSVYAEEPVSDVGEIQTEDVVEETQPEEEPQAVIDDTDPEAQEVQQEEITSDEEPEEPVTEDPVTFTAKVDEELTHGSLMLETSENLPAEMLEGLMEGTTITVNVQPDENYELDMLKVLDENNNEIKTEEKSDLEPAYSFLMPASDVKVTASFKEQEKVVEAVEEKDSDESEVRDLPMMASSDTAVETIPIAMIGFQSYSLAGYGTGYDAAFAPAAGHYDGNANGFCLNPAVQAPGRDQMNTTVTYTTTTTRYSDPILLKILYYGFGGNGDISAQITSEPPSRHILTHMALVRRAAEIGIPGAGNYTYGANSTAISLANRLYDLCAAQPAVSGTAKVLTPVSGQQTIILLAEVIRNGSLTLTKSSADASMTRGNSCYSLSDAVYEVFSDSACTHKVGTFTTGSDGKSKETLSLNPGPYYVKEKTAPKGYALDDTVYTASVVNGTTVDVKTTDIPLNDPVTLILEKVDAKTGTASERLKDAEFTIKYYAGTSVEGDPAKQWVMKTDKNGRIRLDDAHFVSGDPFFLGATGAPVLPLGVITIQETKAPAGYIMNETVYTCSTTEHNNSVVTSNLPTGDNAVREQPVNPEIKTTALSATTGTHTAVASANESVIDTVECKNLVVGKTYTIKGQVISKDKEIAVASGETTFTAESSEQSVDVSMRVYTMNLAGKTLVVFERLYEEGSDDPVAVHEDMNDAEQSIHVVKIGTRASDGQTGSNTGVTGQTTIVDTVSYTNLTVGKTYKVSGTLMNKETGEALSCEGATAEKTFTAESSDGTIDLVYTIDASALKGKSVVVFENLLQDDILVASHASLNDTDQTVDYPEIHTNAKDETTDSHTGLAVPTRIIDTVSYSNLTPGKSYVVKGVLMNKATGEKLNLEGAESETAFTPESADGTVEVVFDIDATSLKGTTTVVFEKLYLDDVEITSHADINDGDQTVEFEQPEIKTTAKDGQTGTQVGTVGPTTIIDTVEYKDLVVGKEYTVSGTLHNKATGEALTCEGATAETTFTAESSDGTVELVYTIDASALAGQSVVVFENITYNNIDVASHADINDKDQTIYYPELSTTAKDGTTDEQEGLPVQTTIVDTVTYKNLVPGKTYTFRGTLMNKATGEPLSIEGAESEFILKPATANGTVDITFTIDASALAGSETVVFEKLIHNDIEVAAHADINDEGQTVRYRQPEIGTTATDGQTGTHTGTVGKTKIVDTVSYKDLIVGKEYRVSGVLMNKETGAELIVNGSTVTNEVVFTAEASEGTVELEYELDASALEGATVVVFEDLYYNNIKVVSHADITDEDQSVHYPRIRTTASINGAKEVTVAKDTRLIDTVSYTNLVVGESYTVTGILMDKATGKELTVGGSTVTGTATFTAEAESGTVDVEFVFDSTSLGDVTTVVFEKLFYAGAEVTSHEDLNDTDQSVTFRNPPKPPVTPNVPNTGDHTKALPYVFGLLMSGICIAVLLYRRKTIR